MSQARSLLRLDSLRVKNWFRRYRATKVAVILGFFAVIAVIIIVEFVMARTFFSFTSLHEDFGRAAAQYSLNAALLLLFLLAVVSSIAANAASLYRTDFLRFLFTLPIPPYKLFSARLVSALFSSMWLVVLLLTPLLVAFGMSFSGGTDFIVRSLAALILLITASHSIGGILTVLIVKKTGRLSGRGLAMMFALVVAGSLLMMRFLFPPSFFRLYYAEDWPSFQHGLGQLPLLASSLPTNWLASTITSGWSLQTAAAAIGTAALAVLAFMTGKRFYLYSWRIAQEGRFLAGKRMNGNGERSSYPEVLKGPLGALLTNEFLSLTRSSGDTTYLAFLTGLMIVLLFMMRSVPALENAAPWLLPAVYALSLAGISYLFMTFSTRVVFPIVAKERRMTWLLFSMPVKRESILMTKAKFAVLLTLPSIILGLLAGKFMLLPGGLLTTYVLLIALTAATVSLIELLLGTIAPNFAESQNPDAASTSGAGLAAIALSLTFIGLTAFAFYKVVIGATAAGAAVLMMAALSAVWIGLLYWLARRAIHRYNL